MMIDFKKELAEKTAAIDTIVNSYLPEASKSLAGKPFIDDMVSESVRQ